MPRGGGYDVTGLAVRVEREGVKEASEELDRLARSADKAEKQVDQLGDESKETSREVGGLGASADKLAGGLKGMLGALAGLTAAYVGFQKLTAAMGAAVAAASEQERIFAGLDIALANAGVNYDALSGHLDKYFAALQKTTIYGDTDSAETLRKLVVVTGDYNSALKLLEPTLQFSAAMNIDIATAARLAGQAATGMTGTLSRYGIILSQTTKDQLAMADAAGKADIVAGMLNQKFGGSAQHELTTYGGALQQLGNYWGDFTEAVGDLFIESELLPALFQEITDALMWLTDVVSAAGDTLAWLQEHADFSAVATSVAELKQALSGFGTEIDVEKLRAISLVFLNVFTQKVADDLRYWAQALNALDGAIEGIIAHGPNLKAVTEGLAEGWSRSTEVIPELVASHETLEDRVARLNAEIQANLAGIQQHIVNLDAMKASTESAADSTDPFIENLKKQQAEITRHQQPVDRYKAMMKDFGKETGSAAAQLARLGAALSALASTGLPGFGAAFMQVMEEYAAFLEMVKDPEIEFPEPPPDAADSWRESFDDIERAFSDMLGKGFTGELESFSDLWEEIWKDLAKSATGILMDAFSDWLRGGKTDAEGNIIEGTGGFMQSLEDLSVGQRVGMGIAGAGMVYQGAQTGGTQGAIQGAMGGAMAGFSIGGPWGAVVGGVVGLLAGIFGGGGEDQPWTDVTRIGPGPMWGPSGTESGYGISTRGQDMTAREDRLFSLAIGQLYRGIAGQWREMLRGFRDSELFELLGDMPEIVDQSFQMTAQEVEAWLREDKLPQLFQRQYARAIRTGLRNLEMTGDAIEQLFDELREMPGSERMEGLVAVVTALRTFADAIAMDWEAINEEAMKSPMQEWIDSMVDAGEQMELLTTGWEDMSLIERAHDLEQIGLIFESVTQSTIAMLRQLEQISRSIDAMFATTIEGFTTRGMDEDALWAYYEERYNYYNNLLQTTDDPNLILQYTQEMLRILQAASGMLTDEQWLAEAGDTGMTWQEWFLAVTRDAQAAADAAVQEQIDRVQEQYDRLWEQMGSTRDWFMALSEAVAPVIPPLDELPRDLDDFRDALNRATYALDSSVEGMSAKSMATPQDLKITVEQEPPHVVVNVNGSLAQLQTMVATEVNRRALVTERVILNAIS